jgi:hypothetical protein
LDWHGKLRYLDCCSYCWLLPKKRETACFDKAKKLAAWVMAPRAGTITPFSNLHRFMMKDMMDLMVSDEVSEACVFLTTTSDTVGTLVLSSSSLILLAKMEREMEKLFFEF